MGGLGEGLEWPRQTASPVAAVRAGETIQTVVDWQMRGCRLRRMCRVGGGRE